MRSEPFKVSYVLRIYRTYSDAGFKAGFRSAYVLAQNVESALSPSSFGRKVIKELLLDGLLFYDNLGRVFLNKKGFEGYIQGLPDYECWLAFFDEISTVRF